MGRIECGDGEDGEPVGAHRADPDGRRRAGMPAGAWMIDWGGREAGAASRIFRGYRRYACGPPKSSQFNLRDHLLGSARPHRRIFFAVRQGRPSSGQPRQRGPGFANGILGVSLPKGTGTFSEPSRVFFKSSRELGPVQCLSCVFQPMQR